MTDLLALLASAPTTVTVATVHDGDTFDAHIPLGTKALLGVDLWAHDVPLRIHGCNARELSQPGGPEAHDNLAALLPAGQSVSVVLSRDKYAGRRDAAVTLPDGRDLTGLLCAAGWAAPWDGRGPRPVPPWPRPTPG